MSEVNVKDLKIVFMGTPEYAQVVLSSLIGNGFNVSLVICQPDKPIGRKKIITPPPAKVTAVENNIPVFQPETFRDDLSYETVLKYEPDLIITAAYGKILPQRVLDIPKYGCINVHASLLPKYRGASPVHASILNGEKETGVTVMNMDAGMDTGDILVQAKTPIDINIDTLSLTEELSRIGAELLVSMLQDYVDGKITPLKQDENLVTNCKPIVSEDGLIDWNESAVTIHNKIRALAGWPGAYSLAGDNKFKFYRSHLIDEDFEGVPGTIVKAKKGDLFIKCGQGVIAIDELQQPGGKRLAALDCAHNFTVGKIIGE